MTDLTPRLIIAAAIFLGDNVTATYCPTGLNSAGHAQLVALVQRAEREGMTEGSY